MSLRDSDISLCRGLIAFVAALFRVGFSVQQDRIDHTGFGLVEKCRIICEGFDIDAGDIAVFNGDFHFNIPVKSASGTVVGAIRIFSLRSSFCDLW